MKKQINALVVDDSMEFTSSVVEYFRDNAVIKIVDVIADGTKAVSYIERHQKEIDIILMDLVMPGKDGIQILKELEKLNIKKHCIILSSYRKEYSIEMTKKFHVDYYMIKPIILDALEDRIKEIMEERVPEIYIEKKVNNRVQLEVTNLLHSLGIPSQVKGYQYLREGILMLYSTSGLIGGITKKVYPEIAHRFNTTPSRVERAIRHAIEISWVRGDYELMNRIFGHSIDYDRAKPTNSEFMVTISDALRLKQIA